METILNFVKYSNITNSIVVDPSFQGVNKPVLSFSECDGQKHLQGMLTKTEIYIINVMIDGMSL